MEFKIVNTPDGKRQTITCDCLREIEIIGSVASIYSTKGGRFATEHQWVKVPRHKIKRSHDE